MMSSQGDLSGSGELNLSEPRPLLMHKSIENSISKTSSRSLYDALPLTGDKIRIISLLPSQEINDILCHMETAELAEKPSYNALSYLWGEPNADCRFVFINGIQLRVRQNLYQALLHLRSKFTGVRLWVDAICINQSDADERSQQVRRMGTIYEQATCVYVWIGEETHDRIEAIEILKAAETHIPPTDEELRAALRSLREKGVFNQRCMGVLFKFWSEHYWQRVWIIQEIVLASKLVVCCGSHRLSWDTMCATAEVLKKWPGMLKPDFGEIAALPPEFFNHIPNRLQAQRLKRHSSGKSFFDTKTMLGISLEAGCSDPRDKIYGLLGVIDSPSMPIDYSKSLFEVYCDMIHHIQDQEVRGPLSEQDWFTISYSQKVQELLQGPFLPTFSVPPAFVRIKGVWSGVIDKLSAIIDPEMSLDTISTLSGHLFEPRKAIKTSLFSRPARPQDPDILYRWVHTHWKYHQYTIIGIDSPEFKAGLMDSEQSDIVGSFLTPPEMEYSDTYISQTKRIFDTIQPAIQEEISHI
jgi:hypothetical protein